MTSFPVWEFTGAAQTANVTSLAANKASFRFSVWRISKRADRESRREREAADLFTRPSRKQGLPNAPAPAPKISGMNEERAGVM